MARVLDYSKNSPSLIPLLSIISNSPSNLFPISNKHLHIIECTMSIAGLIDTEMNHKKSFHRRNDSGELDVFEASRYFSGYNEVIGYTNSNFTQKMMIRDEKHGGQHRGRISLDMPMRSLLPQQFHGIVEKQIVKEKKHKQPSSPGGKLASFLNSLFSQSSSKKKKSKSSSQSMKDEDDVSRRRRRSSISHFRSSSTTTSDSRSLYSSLSSGFRTPPYINTPTKSCKEFRTFAEQKHAHDHVSLSMKNNGNVKSTTLENELWGDKKKREPLVEKERIWVDKYSREEKEIVKFNEVDYGAESDSSSDLFELQNYDLGYSSSGLPVYETTNMDNIKRGSTISNVV